MSNTKKFRNIMVTFWVEHWGPENPCEFVREHNLTEVQYMVSGFEVCPDTGREHWQSYIELKNRYRISAIQDMFKHNKWKILDRHGTQEDAIKYCKKDGQWQEYGTPKRQGRRTDISIDRLAENETLLEAYESVGFETAARMHSGIEKLYNLGRNRKLLQEAKEEIISIPLHPWQNECIHDLMTINRRKISWYWEPVGGVGKSHLVTYLAIVHDALVLTNTSYKDCTYLYNNHKYVVFDLPRSDYTPNYATIEAFANHILTSTKYVPQNKVSRATVIVFANYPPDEYALSADRWNVNRIIHSENGPEVTG